MTDFQALVCQLGAREHYLVARCLARRGLLACLATDFWSPLRPTKRKTGLVNRLPRVFSGALARYHPELDGQRVASFPLLGVTRYLGGKIGSSIASEKLFSERFARAIKNLDVAHDVFFGYSYASLEMLEAEKERGVFTILGQIDPAGIEFQLVAEEMRRHPDVAGKPPLFPAAYFERAHREWQLADAIVVNSTWCRDSIVSDGADPKKIEILPLAYEVAKPEVNGQTSEGGREFQVSGYRFSASAPLRVLWLGQVNVRKGIHYLVEAARLLEREQVTFLVVGSPQIRREYMASAPSNISWLGAMSRSRVGELYRKSDVFVLPTLSDGFAITQLEALAHGLPVIATPNCGQVIENEKTGFLVPPRDPRALADAIMRFARDRSLAQTMRPRCLEAVKSYSIDAYGKRLIEIANKYRVH